ncbi:MAG: hypothetical protein DF168_01670 [Candidatus Moanabacter tarae]|uniref:Uncharacterized protein n=1 Tax=Candidatus Moanibacter tarae TaxID=2200854 RepID=A0A2Z4AH19_9BACT|nr:MAG: hypothetical protein DF168_01670 [Candidatus Moanabacter tarae]
MTEEYIGFFPELEEGKLMEDGVFLPLCFPFFTLTGYLHPLLGLLLRGVFLAVVFVARMY